jgi:NADH:ubiquinone oxidoreductase subunit 4 (subunit M)
MPTLFYFWMLAALANLGLPGLSGFVAETAVFYGSFTSWMAQMSGHAGAIQVWILFACTGVVLTAGYMLWLLKRLFYGAEQPKWAGHLTDAVGWEKGLSYAMCFMILAMGLYPALITNSYDNVVNHLFNNITTRLSIGSAGQTM